MKNDILLDVNKNLKEINEIKDASQNIVFYAESSSDWNHYSRIINELIDTFNIKIYYVTSDHTDQILSKKNKNIYSYYIGYDNARSVFFQTLQFKVFVTTTPDLGKFNFVRSSFDVHYVFIFSSLISSHMGYMHDSFDNFDSILCLGPHQYSELKTIERHYGLKSKDIVKCGYGHLENIIDNFKSEIHKLTLKENQAHVVIAPTYGQNSLLEIDNGELCCNLIAILAEAKIAVTLRPHWMTVNNNPNLIAKIIKRHKKFSNFNLEKNLTSINSLFDSDVLISDLSGVALEYFFAFQKPVIYIDVPVRYRNSDFNAINTPAFEVEMRPKTGEIVDIDHLSTLPDLIKNLVKNNPFKSHDIINLRSKSLFNLGSSGKVGADYLINLLNKIASSKSVSKPLSTLLSLKNASVKYPNGVVGMQKSDFDIYDGQLTVLIGPSGAGKSTMLRTLNGLVPLSTGTISTKANGQLDSKNAWSSHQKKTAMIFQQHQLIGRQSALHNVLLGRVPHHGNMQCLLPWSKNDKLIALESLDRVGLLSKALQRVSNLSGGEMQRVGIARALTQQPNIILADEPVASLDPAISLKILTLLNEICLENSISAIVSLHQVDLAKKFANKLIGISKGKIIFQGSSDDLTFEILRDLYGESYIEDPVN